LVVVGILGGCHCHEKKIGSTECDVLLQGLWKNGCCVHRMAWMNRRFVLLDIDEERIAVYVGSQRPLRRSPVIRRNQP
jgi:hypothetical protein